MPVFLLIVLGLVLPLAAGLLMNNYIFQSSGTGLPYLLISIGFLVLWAIIGFAARSRAGSTWKVVLALNAAASLDWLLVAIQEFVLGNYWPNTAGIWTPRFFCLNCRYAFQPARSLGGDALATKLFSLPYSRDFASAIHNIGCFQPPYLRFSPQNASYNELTAAYLLDFFIFLVYSRLSAQQSAADWGYILG